MYKNTAPLPKRARTALVLVSFLGMFGLLMGCPRYRCKGILYACLRETYPSGKCIWKDRNEGGAYGCQGCDPKGGPDERGQWMGWHAPVLAGASTRSIETVGEKGQNGR